MSNKISFETTLEVRDNCLCLYTQRAARALARRFDEALGGVGLTNGQFSLLIALNRPQAPAMGAVAQLLAMDRTTLTAALKPLERKGLVTIATGTDDRRSRRLALTDKGHEVLVSALPIWRETHAAVEAELSKLTTGTLRASLQALSMPLQ